MSGRKKLALLLLIVLGSPVIVLGCFLRFTLLAAQVGWWWVEDVYVGGD